MHIVILVVACIVTLVAFSAFAVLRYANGQRDSDSRQIINTARALSAAIDVKLKIAEAALSALATAPDLRNGDLVEFYEQCHAVAAHHMAKIVLADSDGNAVFTTRRPFGEPGFRLKSADLVRAAAQTRAVLISNVFYAAFADRLQISVFLPIVERGSVANVLLLSFDIEQLSQVLRDQHMPDGWTVSLFDRSNKYVARNRDIDRFGGEMATQSFLDRIAVEPEGAFEGITGNGVPALTAFTKSQYTDWTLAIEAPLADISGPFNRTIFDIGLAAAAMLVFGTLIAVAMGGRMAGALSDLSKLALALGDGAPIAPARRNITEIDNVLLALCTADALLRQRTQALQQSERRFRDIAETAGDWIWETDQEHRFSFLGGAGTESSAIDTMLILGKTRWEHAGGEVEREEYWREHKADLDAHWPFRDFRYSVSDQGGRRLHYVVNGKPVFDETGVFVGYRGTATNETAVVEAREQRRLLEEQLHHSQKLEALGTLAGGIAHDLNNALMPVIAVAKIGIQSSEPRSATRQDFELIHQAGLRGRGLIKQVLAFSRKGMGDRRLFHIHEVVDEALAMLRPAIPSTIVIESEIRSVPPIIGDPTHIHQVFVNLMTNAVHAIGLQLGTISVSLGAMPAAKPGEPGFIRLVVKDSGCGMDEAIQRRIFDPFFTTKGVGEGTGLGLSVVHGIVASHGGKIVVESELGVGARFIVDLPLPAEAAEAPAIEEKIVT